MIVLGKIVLLDELTINKIAAGEVVDRPSSIVKELVENSVDAGAKNIIVEIKNGGISYIKITDDGIGFLKDDVEIAFERHATSKIRKESDILKITSMGFRGEALASISAISKVSLVTKNINENVGTKIEVVAGDILSKSDYASTTGTSITIRDVFFNTPARFKFMKKDYTEAGYIEEAIIRLAISNSNVAFRYINNNKVILATKGKGLKNAIYDIFGKDIYDNLIDVDFVYKDLKVSGVVGSNTISKSNRNYEYTFVNNRHIKNKTLISAIEEGFKQNISIGRFPFCSLFLEIAANKIDVNVHPAKLEIKFEDENEVFSAIHAAVKEALERHNKSISPFYIAKEEIINNQNYNKSYEIKEEQPNYISQNITNNVVKEFIPEIMNIENKEEIPVNSYITDNIIIPESIPEKASSVNFLEETKQEKQVFKYIGSLLNTYILIEMNDKLYIIDQHAAHERLLYEKIKKMYLSKENKTQMLLISDVINLDTKEFTVVKDNIEKFEDLGYILEEFGYNAYKISGVPDIDYINYKNLFMDFIEELNLNKNNISNKQIERSLATVACKAAVKGNMKLTKEEDIALINNMIVLDNPFTCPHGRPTAFEISKYDIERKIDRK